MISLDHKFFDFEVSTHCQIKQDTQIIDLKELFFKHNIIRSNYSKSLIQNLYFVEDYIHYLFHYFWSKKYPLGDIDSVIYYLLSSFRRRLFRILGEKEKGQKLLKGIKFGYQKGEDFFGKKFVVNFNVNEKERTLKLVVDKLPKGQKEVLQKRFLVGLPYNDKTSKIGTSNVSSKKLVSEAIKILRNKIPLIFLKKYAIISVQPALLF